MKAINQFLFVSSLFAFFSHNAYAATISANEDGLIGLYPSSNMKITTGKCQDCPTIAQARWYFENELIGVPRQGISMAGFSTSANAQQDIPQDMDKQAMPGLIWLGSSQVITGASISTKGEYITLENGKSQPFAIVPKIATNHSYWNENTLRFFSQRAVKLRGDTENGKFIARTVWPADYTITQKSPLYELSKDESLKSLVQYESGGAKSPYASRLLWERQSGITQQSTGKSVIGLMLNGAQGDDDEAHGGHFGIVTGRYSADGNWSNWLVNNIYNLDAFSEKGIVAAPTPMDKYLTDLNNGQSYYRPSYMLVAIMRNDAVASSYQATINRVYNHFYRHDFVYDHSLANCAGVSLDTFKSLGWKVPERGTEGQLKAIGAWFYVALTSGNIKDARKLYDYLTTETTRLYPAVAFDVMGNDLLELSQGKTSRQLTPFEQEMANDIEAIFFVRIPQIPSSRAYGQAPVYSFDQYLKQAPADRSQWQIVPTKLRPFPNTLRDGLALNHEARFPVPWPVGIVALALLAIFTLLIRSLWCRLAPRLKHLQKTYL